MNIFIPDSWLREYLKTKATPTQIREYLSLCGPSVEKIMGEVYEIEVTSNRPDCMSVYGIAREAAAILPRFGIPAKLVNVPTPLKVRPFKGLKLSVKTDAKLNPRWTSVVFDNVTIKSSPKWLSTELESAGIRSINNVIDITNFLMRTYGQPAHVFDYDAIQGHRMNLRLSKIGEKVTTLDEKIHALPGDDIVIEDGSGKLIDLCGIMGGKNSAVTQKTTRVVLFLQTYDPAHIRKTSMALAHHTEAASLFEKGLDPEQVWPVFCMGVEMMKKLTGGTIASSITDIYPQPYKPKTVAVSRSKIESYIGNISDREIKEILISLGFHLGSDLKIKIPSFRRDVEIDVDIIEEIARIYGYHNIKPQVPSGELPVVIPDPTLRWEEEVKIRLRDWGYTEVLTYSMISENQMDSLHLDKTLSYKISNPLSTDWVYMRPVLWPSTLAAFKQNHQDNIRAFELSMSYEYRRGDLPLEKPTLVILWSGQKYFEAKGLAEAIFDLFGISFDLNSYGSIEQKRSDNVTMLCLDFAKLVANAKPAKTYTPIPKYPPIVEDLAFIVPNQFEIGPLLTALKSVHPLIYSVTLLDVHENTRTVHIEYLDRNKNLTDEEVRPIREKIIRLAEENFILTLKTP